MRDRCRATNKYLEFLQGINAEDINIKYHDESNIEFEVNEKKMNYLNDDIEKKYRFEGSVSEYKRRLNV